MITDATRRAPTAQRGAALILALVVLALVVILASSLGNDFMVGLRRVENQLHSQQAYSYLLGAEGLARQLLQRDLRDSPDKDHASEGWLGQRQDFPTDYGMISGTLSDEQALFNLNTLGSAAPANAASQAYSRDQQRFIRLLQLLELEEPLSLAQAQDLCNALSDWIDADSDERPGGAESFFYEAQDPPYRSANRALNSVSELRWVKGFTPVIYRALQPYVTVFGDGTINVNTAPLLVLRSINEDNNLLPLDSVTAESIIAERDSAAGSGSDGDGGATIAGGGFDQVDIFQRAPWDKLDTAALGIRTMTVRLHSSTLFLQREFGLQTVLQRDNNGTIRVLARARSGL